MFYFFRNFSGCCLFTCFYRFKDIFGGALWKENVTELMGNLSAVAEESATTEEISATTQEQIASAEVLLNLAIRLADLSLYLHKGISKFQTR